MAAGLVAPAGLLRWLTGPGAWFALLYQVIGLAWLAGLVMVANRTTLRRGWLVRPWACCSSWSAGRPWRV